MTRGTTAAAAGVGTAVFAAVALASGADEVAAARLAILGGALGAVAMIDVREHRIPNAIVLPATCACAALLAVEPVRLASLVPALVLVAALAAVSLSVPAALGMGDVKLALLLAVGIGDDAVTALAAGFALAACYALVLLARHGRTAARTALPLAPFLATGALGVLVVA
jgi:leader peptidase (prepilin peptidase) / N-methyltransferase